jgi:hypothetical protein
VGALRSSSRWGLPFLAAVLLAAGTGGASAARVGPAPLLRAVLAAAEREHSLHYVATSRFGVTIVVQVGDVGTTEGVQRITYTYAGTTGHVTVVVTAAGAFLEGDSFTLSHYLGFPAAGAKRDAGSWLFVARSARAFSSLAAAVTLPSFVSELDLHAPLARVAGKVVAGVAANGIQGSQASGAKDRLTGVLYAAARGLPLPIEEVLHGDTVHETITISHWNEKLFLVLPSRTAPKSGSKKPGPGLIA